MTFEEFVTKLMTDRAFADNIFDPAKRKTELPKHNITGKAAQAVEQVFNPTNPSNTINDLTALADAMGHTASLRN